MPTATSKPRSKPKLPHPSRHGAPLIPLPRIPHPVSSFLPRTSPSGPTRPKISPSSTVRFSRSTAVRLSKDFVRATASIACISHLSGNQRHRLPGHLGNPRHVVVSRLCARSLPVKRLRLRVRVRPNQYHGIGGHAGL